MSTFTTEMVPPAITPGAPGQWPASRVTSAAGELSFPIGVPLLWAILLLFHPGGEDDQIYLDAKDNVTSSAASAASAASDS